jgi:hypothetical protein
VIAETEKKSTNGKDGEPATKKRKYEDVSLVCTRWLIAFLGCRISHFGRIIG